MTDEDVKRVQEEARALIAAKALTPRTGGAISANRLSDFARVNRVEGLALGAGAAWHATPVLSLGILARYGFDDQVLKARLSAAFTLPHGRTVTLFAAREYRDASDVAERSLAVNSLSSQEYGSDFTDPYEVQNAGLRVGLGAWHDVRLTLTGTYEKQSGLAVHATPFRFSYEPTLPASFLHEWRFSLRAEREWALGTRSDLRLDATLTGGWMSELDSATTGFGRAFVEAQLVSGDRIAAARASHHRRSGDALPMRPAQEQVLLGGPITGPGYGYHQFAAAFGASQRVEWRMPVPFWSVPLGSFGRTPASFTLAPYAHVVYVDRSAIFAQPAEGWYPSLGAGASFFFDLVRINVARGLRNGTWYFGVDLAHDLWSIL